MARQNAGFTSILRKGFNWDRFRRFIAGSLQVSEPKKLTVDDGSFCTNSQALWADFTISGVGQ